jgi:hypothetical protein
LVLTVLNTKTNLEGVMLLDNIHDYENTDKNKNIRVALRWHDSFRARKF